MPNLGLKLGLGALLGGAGNRDFPYPTTFQKTVLNRYRLASDFTTDAQYSVVDNPSTDNPYGAATVPLVTLNGSLGIIRPSALTTTAGVDMSNGGQVRINYRPVSGVTNISTWQMLMSSGTNVASLGSNYHQCDMPNFKSQCTGVNGNGAGRWQSVAAPIAPFAAIGSGSNLSAERFTQIRFFGTAQFELGDVEFWPNPRTKAGVIISMDDGDPSAYTIMKSLLDAVGAAGVLFPGAIGNTIGVGGNLSIAQWLALLGANANVGWQSASQKFSTENNVIYDAWTLAQQLAEEASARNFVAPYGRRRDTYDGSYASNIGFRDMAAWAALRASYRTLTNFVNGSATGNPLAVSEVFPFADPYNIVRVNLNSWGDVADIYESHMFNALEQTRLARGMLVIGMHNELNLPSGNHVSAVQKIINYVNVLHPSEMEFTTIRKALAPYNGDTLVG